MQRAHVVLIAPVRSSSQCVCAAKSRTPSARTDASTDAGPLDSPHDQLMPDLSVSRALAAPAPVARRRLSVPMSASVLVARRMCDRLRRAGVVATKKKCLAASDVVVDVPRLIAHRMLRTDAVLDEVFPSSNPWRLEHYVLRLRAAASVAYAPSNSEGLRAGGRPMMVGSPHPHGSASLLAHAGRMGGPRAFCHAGPGDALTPCSLREMRFLGVRNAVDWVSEWMNE